MEEFEEGLTERAYFASKKRRKRVTTVEWLTIAAIVLVFSAIMHPVAGGDGIRPASVNLRNAKQLGLALIMFTNDHGDLLPNDKDPAKLVNDLAPYLNSKENWTTRDPAHGTYLFNGRLSGVRWDTISHPDRVVLIFATQPDAQGMRAVCFADGHARAVDEAQWQRLLSTPLITNGAKEEPERSVY